MTAEYDLLADFVDRADRARSLEQIEAVHEACFARVGIRYVMASHIMGDPLDPEPGYYWSASPGLIPWFAYYYQERCYLYDPVLQALQQRQMDRKQRPVQWSVDLDPATFSDKQKQLMVMAAAVGLTDGLTISMYRDTVFSRLAVLSYIPQPGVDLKPLRYQLMALAGFFWNAVESTVRPPRSQLRDVLSLTARQREVLRYLAEGKRAADISLLLGVKLTTVRQHERAILAALQVDTMNQAIAVAVEERLIEPRAARLARPLPQVAESR
ncbi:MAG: LuxR C-terminal-related transcriptional regulator [Rhodothalassiaceae bacterium]